MPRRDVAAGLDDDALWLELSVEGVGVRMNGVRPALVADGAHIFAGHPARTEKTPDGLYLEWDTVGAHPSLGLSLHLAHGLRPGEMLIRGAVTNTGSQPVRLDFIQPLSLRADHSGILAFGCGETGLKMLIMTDSTGGYGTRIADLRSSDQAGGGALTSYGVTALHAPAAGVTLAAGFLDFTNQAGVFSVQPRNTPGDSAQVGEFTAELEYLKPIAPGETVNLAPLWLAVGRNPNEMLELYAVRLRDCMHVKLPPSVPCGWISWYGYRVELDEKIVRENAAVQARTMRDLGGTLCHLDLGWNAADRPGDWLEIDDSFPSGLPQLCHDLVKDGFQVALWSTPLIVAENSRLAREHPAWLLRDGSGRPVVFDTWYWEPQEICYCLDPTLAAVQEHVRRVYSTLRGWGVTAFKLDFSGAFQPGLGNQAIPEPARAPIPYGGETMTRMQACRKTYGLIREAIGDAHMTACNVPWQGVVGIADSAFLATDIGNLTDSESQDERPARRGWDLFMERTRHIFTRYFFHGKVWWGNPDCFVAENDAPENCARARLQVVMLAGGQYKCSNQLPGWKPERMDMFLKGLPWYGRAARPRDLFTADHPSVLDLPVSATWGDWHVVGLFNWSDRPESVAFDLSRLQPRPEGEQLIWEFWDQRFIGVYADKVCLQMPPQSASLLCVRPKTSQPVLLATDMHFTMGAMELPDCVWNQAARELSGTARRKRGMTGNLYFYLPHPYRHAQAETVAGGSILRYGLVFGADEESWRIHL